MKFFQADLKRAFTNTGFFLSLIISGLIFAHAIYINTNFEVDNSTYELIANAMSLSGYTPFASVFPAIGYAATFCLEYRSGYLTMITSRMDWKKFSAIRMCTVALAGGAATAIPIGCVCLFSWLKGVPGMPDNGFYVGTQIEVYFEIYGDWYVLGGKVLLAFLFGVMWALAALTFAAWTGNRYLAVIGPFVLYELLWMLLFNIRFLNPIFLLRGDDLNDYPLSAGMELLYILLFALICWFGLYRRMRHE